MNEDDHAIANALGGLAIVLGAAVLFLALAASSPSRGADLRAAWPWGVVLLALGVLAFKKVSFAVVLLAGTFALSGAWLAIGGLMRVPLPWSLINAIMGALLLAPAALLLRSWRRRRVD